MNQLKPILCQEMSLLSLFQRSYKSKANENDGMWESREGNSECLNLREGDGAGFQRFVPK